MKIPKFQLIEVGIQNQPVGQMQQFNFGQQPQLQSITGNKQVFIKAMNAYTSDMMPKSPLTPQNNVLQAADIGNAVLVLSVAGILEFNLVPLVNLVNIQGTVSPFNMWWFEFRNLYQVDWTKSYIQFINAPVTTAPFSALFGVAYDYTPDPDDVFSGYQTLH